MNGVLDAKVLIDGTVVEDKLSSDVQRKLNSGGGSVVVEDNLESTSSENALSANMGRELNENKVGLDEQGNLNLTGNNSHLTYNGQDIAFKSEISSGSIDVSDTERLVGTYNINGRELNLYQKSFLLTDPPTTAGEEKTFNLTDESIGAGTYVRLDGLSVKGNPTGTTFNNGIYTLKSIRILSDGRSVADIVCNLDSPNTVSLTLTLTYCKGINLTGLELLVTVSDGTNPEDVNLSFPILKYDKDIVFSWINDDSVSIWNDVFNLINGKFVDDEKMSFFDASDTRNFTAHKDWEYLGYTKTTGYVYPDTLEYSDGIGGRRRFATSLSAWDFRLDGRDTVPGILSPWASAPEIRTQGDFGFSVLYHDLEPKPTTQEEYDTALEIAGNKFLELTDRIPKIMAEPNGDKTYLTFGFNNPTIQMQVAQANSPGFNVANVYPFRSDFTLDKIEVTVERRFNNDIVPGYVDGLISSLQEYTDTQDKDTVQWLIGASHTASPIVEGRLLKLVYENFGLGGLDNIWFPSVDEMFEYWYFRTNATVTKEVVDSTHIKFTIAPPTTVNSWFSSASCLISGNVTSIEASENCQGFSYGTKGSNTLVNIDFSTDLVEKAEKYLTLAENSRSSFDFQDAEYFIGLLRDSLKSNFTNRLEAKRTLPNITSILIDGISDDSVVVHSKSITIETQTDNSEPVHIRFNNGGEWLDINQTMLYTLGDGENFTLRIQVKNGFGESNVYTKNIQYVELPLELSSILINNGDLETNILDVEVSFNFTGNPTEYILSETEPDESTQWSPWTGAVQPFTLSQASNYPAVKTIYAKIRDAQGTESSVVSSSITIVEPISFRVVIANVIRGGEEIPNVGWVNCLGASGNHPNVLKDLRGNEIGNIAGDYYNTNSAVYDACRALFNIQDEKLTTSPAYWAKPVFVDDNGRYPNEIIWNGTNTNINLYGRDQEPSPEQCFGRYLYNLLPGEYTVNILLSAGENSQNGSKLSQVVRVQNSTQVVTTQMMEDEGLALNNNSKYITFDSVTVGEDGYMVIAQYGNEKYPYGYSWTAPITIIELIKKL